MPSPPILTLFGTRPEVIKLAPVIRALEAEPAIWSIVVSTSQHREMIDDLIDLFGIRVDHDLNVIRHDQSPADVCLRALEGLDPLLQEWQPRMLLVQGDTTTAFIGALAAYYRHIPVGHVEAGLRSWDRDHPFPEEVNRRLISVVAELHFPATEEPARNLIREGVDPERIFRVGNPVIDALLEVAGRDDGDRAPALSRRAADGKRLVLVTAHRRENWGEPLEALCRGLVDIVEAFDDVCILYPVHLNPRVRETVWPILDGRPDIHLCDPLRYDEFVAAMNRSHLIITDSGGIQEEAPALGKPVLVYRKVTERNEGVEAGGVNLVGISRERLVSEATRLLTDADAYRRMAVPRFLFGDGRAGERIVQAILHYLGLAERPNPFVPRVP